ncbi:MAG: hypothetical protein KIG14_00290 [Candidatus Sacchiramonaceae bacterium]|nr:hypothetical protein [Candidatus Saccharimonadaceae bacterium]
MFELDDRFFDEIGLNQMPEAEKASFKEHIQEEIQVRIGERIADGMTVEKMQEFENIIDNIPGYVAEWLAKNSPNHTEDEIFKALKAQASGAGEDQILSEYAAMKWLSVNRPDFTQIIATVVDEMKNELRSSTDRILG